MKAIVYSLASVGCLVPGLPPGADPTDPDVIAKVVPANATHVLVDQSSLPPSDPSAWKIVDGAIVVDAAGLAASLATYANARQESILDRTAWSHDVGVAGAPMVLTTYLDRDGQNAMVELLLWAMSNADVPGATEAYTNIDLTTFVLTPAQAQTMALAMGAVKSQSRATLSAVLAKINAMPPAITTTAAIDAAAWPSAAS